MNYLSSDFENDNLSIEVDITGTFESTDSFESTDHTAGSAGQVGGNLDSLLGISNIPTSRDGPTRPGYVLECVQLLRQILELGPTSLPNRSFMSELSDVRVHEQPRMCTGSQVVHLTGEDDVAAVRKAGQPSTSGRGEDSDEGSESSGKSSESRYELEKNFSGLHPKLLCFKKNPRLKLLEFVTPLGWGKISKDKGLKFTF